MPEALRPMEDQPQLDEDMATSITSLWRDAVVQRSGTHDAIQLERRFMYRGEHYADETPLQHNQHRLQPRGRQTWSKHRHKLGLISRAEPFIDFEPLDPESTADDGELAVSIMKRLMYDPKIHFRRTLRRVESMALAARIGAMGLTVHYSSRGIPTVIPYLMDGTRLFWTPGWQDLDDITCPWVIEERRMLCSAVRDMKDQGWGSTDQVMPDDGERIGGDNRPQATDQSLDILGSPGNYGPGRWLRKDKATVLLCWFREDQTRKTQDTEQERELPPDQQYYACPACSYRETPPEALPGVNPTALPDEGGLCPNCLKQDRGVMLGKVTHEVVTEDVLAYPDGRLVIVAPVSHVVLYDGPWPWQIRNVPYMVYPCYEDPTEQIGMSDTTWDWDHQLILNALDRKAYYQIMRAPSVIITNDELTMNDTDEPLEFTDEPLQIGRWRGVGQPSVTFFQPQTVTPGMSYFRQAIEADLRSDQGIADIGLTGDQLKGVQVGVAQQAEKMGEIPVEDHIAQLQDRLSNFLGVWWDIWREVNESRQSIPVPTSSGRYDWVKVRGSDLKNFHFTVSGAPDWKQIDDEHVQTVQTLLQSSDPGVREIIAQAANLPPSIVRKIEKLAEQQKPQPPQSSPDKVLTALATGFKDGLPVSPEQWEAAKMAAGLPASQPAAAPSDPRAALAAALLKRGMNGSAGPASPATQPAPVGA